MKPKRYNSPGLRIDQGPEAIGEILGRLFTQRGWGRRQARLHVEEKWSEAVGPEKAKHTRVCNLRRGILEIEVNSGILLQELVQFHKRQILQKLRESLAELTITDIRFRAGSWSESH